MYNLRIFYLIITKKVIFYYYKLYKFNKNSNDLFCLLYKKNTQYSTECLIYNSIHVSLHSTRSEYHLQNFFHKTGTLFPTI